jgi:hypothetical protein
MVTEQLPVPEHPAPLQPTNVEPVAGEAVSTTMVPVVNELPQVPPQEIPAGLELTAPVPVPDRLTLSEKRIGALLNVAVTDCAAFIVSVQAPVPEHPAPLQPPKVEPESGEAVSVITVPTEYELLQVPPQAIPAGLEITVPVPVPVFVRDSEKVGALPPRYTVTKSESVFPLGQASVQTPLYL